MAKRAVKLMGEICLYGAQQCGFAFIASPGNGANLLQGGFPADRSQSVPMQYGTATEALWAAQGALRDLLGATAGPRAVVRVFAPGGEFCADISLHATRYFGDLPWRVCGAVA